MPSMEWVDDIDPQHLKKYRLTNLLWPALILSNISGPLSVLNFMAIGKYRFILLCIMFFIVVIMRNTLRLFDIKFMAIIAFYLTWCFLTSFWSGVPSMSFMKSGMFFFGVVTLLCAGMEWVRVNSWQKGLNFLWPIGIFAPIGAFRGQFSSASSYENYSLSTGHVALYSGIGMGANMLGIMLAMSAPYILWSIVTSKKPSHRYLWLLMLACSVYYLLLTMSRAALLEMICMLTGYLMSQKLSKKILLFSSSIILFIAAVLIIPGFEKKFELWLTLHIYKSNYNSQLFATRAVPWQQSVEGAIEGGIFGIGFGTSYGQSAIDSEYAKEWTAREKGNSQLAIIEEVGLIGFVSYLFLISYCIYILFWLYSRNSSAEYKSLIGLVGGTFIGIFANSCFEGWWDAPGSLEFLFCWLIIGLICGLKRYYRENGAHYVSA